MTKEPKIDLSAFQLVAGHAEELVQHIKDWVEWRLAQEKPAAKTKGDK